MKKSREGFTLVELLIVIVVIGILTAIMMLSSTEAVTSAKASNIVSNLRNIKTATLAYYADHMDKFATDTTKNPPALADIKSYLNGENIPELNQDKGPYEIKKCTTNGDTSEGKWFITYDVSKSSNSTVEQSKIKEKLAGRAGASNLTVGASSAKYESTGNVVGMEIR